MNKQQRKQIGELKERYDKAFEGLWSGNLFVEDFVDVLREIKDDVECLRDEEEEKYDNLNENLQYSEKGQAIEEARDTLDTCVDNLEALIEAFEELDSPISDANSSMEEIGDL